MLDAEKALWTAVLVQAIDDLAGVKTGCHLFALPRLRHFARLWFTSDSHEPGSFRWICDQLELDASRLRRPVFAITECGGRLGVQGACVGTEGAGTLRLGKIGFTKAVGIADPIHRFFSGAERGGALSAPLFFGLSHQ